MGRGFAKVGVVTVCVVGVLLGCMDMYPGRQQEEQHVHA